MNSSLTKMSAFVVVASASVSASAAAVVPPLCHPRPPLPSPRPPTHRRSHRSPPAEAKDLVETAVGAGTFNTLAAALTAAGLVYT